MGKKRKGKANEPKEPAHSTCRDCGLVQTVPRYEFFKASRPRCARCGGSLEYGGSWHKTR